MFFLCEITFQYNLQYILPTSWITPLYREKIKNHDQLKREIWKRKYVISFTVAEEMRSQRTKWIFGSSSFKIGLATQGKFKNTHYRLI